MNAKRPASVAPRLARSEWRPEDTQTLERRIDIAQEQEWRRSVVDQLTQMAGTLGETRDLARTNETNLDAKASKMELAAQAARIDVLTSELATLKKIVFYLAPIVLIGAGILEHKGIL